MTLKFLSGFFSLRLSDKPVLSIHLRSSRSLVGKCFRYFPSGMSILIKRNGVVQRETVADLIMPCIKKYILYLEAASIITHKLVKRTRQAQMFLLLHTMFFFLFEIIDYFWAKCQNRSNITPGGRLVTLHNHNCTPEVVWPHDCK